MEPRKTPEDDGKDIKTSTRTKKFHFWAKNAAPIKNENEFLKNSDSRHTWSNGHIQQVFQISERSAQHSRRHDISKSHPLE